MLVKTFASALHGISAMTILVEVHRTDGIGYNLVGLADHAIRESQQRIIPALECSGFRWPGKKIVINLAPADIRKEGSAFDLPLAVGILAVGGYLPVDKLESFVMMGELSLDGSLRPVRGVLPMALRAKAEGFRGMILPHQNGREAAVVDGLEIYGLKTLGEVVSFLRGGVNSEAVKLDVASLFQAGDTSSDPDFSDVRGQENVKRALEVAAAGGHNVLMVGPPGSGKTMLAQRLPGILPPLSIEEALETTRIHSVAGKLATDHTLITRRPFRAPHHTISDVALVGGGSYPLPGEISLAHHGVLFLDELPEYKRSVLEVMRQPLEDRVIRISRTRFTLDYPASFMLVASMNPCPCGYYNHPEKSCTCRNGAVSKYLGRISGPLLDRIDMHIEVVPVNYEKIASPIAAESSLAIRERIIRAREIQLERFVGSSGIFSNAQMSNRMMRRFAQPDESGRLLLKVAMEKLGLSARAYDRIIRVSRTIADLEGSERIQAAHVAEAVNYRSLDRKVWGQ